MIADKPRFRPFALSAVVIVASCGGQIDSSAELQRAKSQPRVAAQRPARATIPMRSLRDAAANGGGPKPGRPDAATMSGETPRAAASGGGRTVQKPWTNRIDDN